MSNKVYQIVTDRIVEQLNKGVIPWRRPWSGYDVACNWNTGRKYNGINAMLLPEGEYATFPQISKAGGKVKKGSKAYIVVLWKFITLKGDDGKVIYDDHGKPDTVPILRFFKVFNIAEQVEDLELRWQGEQKEHDSIAEGEAIVDEYFTREAVTLKNGTLACYSPSQDEVTIPKLELFSTAEDYYSTLFHEMTHSTGHESRLNRDIKNRFGTETYSREELVAEMGSAFLCAQCGIDNDIENTASYIDGWKKFIEGDPRALVVSAGKAVKATKYILDEQDNGEDEKVKVKEKVAQ